MTRLDPQDYHVPVMAQQCLEFLNVHANGLYVDATLGGGGHTDLILGAGGDVSLLTHPSELDLIRQMLRLREIVAHSAEGLAPHHLTYYAQDLASAFHAFYRDCRVVAPEEPDMTAARLKLVKAAKITLANALRLMGMTAPEKM